MCSIRTFFNFQNAFQSGSSLDSIANQVDEVFQEVRKAEELSRKTIDMQEGKLSDFAFRAQRLSNNMNKYSSNNVLTVKKENVGQEGNPSKNNCCILQ